jgi:hypothetical protein
MLDTPEFRRYSMAQAKLRAGQKTAEDTEERESFRKSSVMLDHHRPQNETDPDCDACGTPWPCATAEYLMQTVDV